MDVADVLTPSAVLLATGDNPADALVAGAAAAKDDGVVLLTDNSVMPAETAAYLSAHPGVLLYALGGPAAAADPAALALVGGTRYATGIMVAQAFFGAPEVVGFASGVSYADALAGGVQIALRGGPLILVDPASVDANMRSFLTSIGGGILYAWAYGGPSAIPGPMVTALSNALGGA